MAHIGNKKISLVNMRSVRCGEEDWLWRVYLLIISRMRSTSKMQSSVPRSPPTMASERHAECKQFVIELIKLKILKRKGITNYVEEFDSRVSYEIDALIDTFQIRIKETYLL